MTDKEHVDSGILSRFIDLFWGYGSFEAPIWMVGMEESCGEEDFPKRINAWHTRGERQLDDAKEYHEEIEAPKHFKEGANLQRTWLKLIKTYLAAYGHRTDTGDTRRFQIKSLGRVEAVLLPTCFIELMPLPSPSTGDWWVSDYTDLDYLQTRKAYMAKVADERAKKLRKLVAEHRPVAVLFYGSTLRKHWERVSGTLERHPAHDKLFHKESDGTQFLMMPHPVYPGVTNADYIKVGELLRNRIGGR
ncbi:MAG TPA: hypothetical protein VJ893_05375 [Roseovarius sp.]|nr:hypothetical protein [Roseovarius sp.]